jgi:hypothetical protein
MVTYDHIQLTPFISETNRKKRGGFGGFKIPDGRDKEIFSREVSQKVINIQESNKLLETKYSGIIDPALIFEIEINQSVNFQNIEEIFTSMGIRVLSSAENKKGYWVVFSSDKELVKFREKLKTYGSESGYKYDYFNAFSEIRDIPIEEKIGNGLRKNPLTEEQEYIDLELWRIPDKDYNENFINSLLKAFPDRQRFKITDKLVTKSFVLIRVGITKSVMEEILKFKEVARGDRPASLLSTPPIKLDLDLHDLDIREPNENHVGILVIDSGVISNHPLLEKCIADEQNYQ